MTDSDRDDPTPASLGTCSLLDACTVINLFASRRLPEILLAAASPVGIVEAVYRETVYVYRGGSGDDARERERVDLDPLIEAGLLRVIAATDAELSEFVNLTLQFKGDGEAMTIAVAVARGWPVVTDDRKAIRIIAERTAVRSSLDVVKTWAEASGLDALDLRSVLGDIQTRGNYFPGRDHPFKPWWDAIMDES